MLRAFSGGIGILPICSPSALRRPAPPCERLWSHAGGFLGSFSTQLEVIPHGCPSQPLFEGTRTSLWIWAGLTQLWGFLHTKHKHETSRKFKNTGCRGYRYVALHEERLKKKSLKRTEARAKDSTWILETQGNQARIQEIDYAYFLS